VRRLGIAGTFGPIHYGHLVTAEEALVQFALDSVLFVPTGLPWMKEHGVVSPAEDRYLMTVIATASNPLFDVSRMEVDRDGPTYTVDTLRGLKERYGEQTDLFFITGADACGMSSSGNSPTSCSFAHFIAATGRGSISRRSGARSASIRASR
jgi:nicotinate-nucleotide adenylyltransferase